MGAVLALFLIAVFIIVLLTPRNSRPPAYTDKVHSGRGLTGIDLPPTHKPPPVYTERHVAIPLAVSPAQVYYSSQVQPFAQVQRGGRLNKMAMAENPSVRTEHVGPTHEPLSYQDWICHLNGADRVYINHREHYV